MKTYSDSWPRGPTSDNVYQIPRHEKISPRLGRLDI